MDVCPENAVALELIRRAGYDTTIHYWKDRFGKEVDFAVKVGTEVRQLIPDLLRDFTSRYKRA